MTIWLLKTFPTWLLCIIGIGGPTALAVLCAMWARSRIRSWEAVDERLGFGAAVFAVIGTVYAIFLAFTVVIAWEQLGDAESNIAQEAATLVAVYRDAAAFNDPGRTEIQSRARDYARAVIDSEWTTMEDGEPSDQANQALARLWDAVSRFDPPPGKQSSIYTELYGRLNDLGRYRELRVLSAGASVPSVFWWALIGVGALTIGFTFFMGTRHAWAQYSMVAAMTATISVALILTLLMDHPFTGDVKADPEAFAAALKLMGA